MQSNRGLVKACIVCALHGVVARPVSPSRCIRNRSSSLLQLHDSRALSVAPVLKWVTDVRSAIEMKSPQTLYSDDCCWLGISCGKCTAGDEWVSPTVCPGSRRCKPSNTPPPTLEPTLAWGACCLLGSTCNHCPAGDEHVFPNVCSTSRRCRIPTPAPTQSPPTTKPTEAPTRVPTPEPTLAWGACCLLGSTCNDCPAGDEHVFPNVCSTSRRCMIPTPAPTQSPPTTKPTEAPTRVPTPEPTLAWGACCLLGSTCNYCPAGNEHVVPNVCSTSRRCMNPTSAPTQSPPTTRPTEAPMSVPTPKATLNWGECCLWGSTCNQCPAGDEHVLPDICSTSRRCKTPTPAPTPQPPTTRPTESPTRAPTSTPTLTWGACCLWGSTCNQCPGGNEPVHPTICSTSRRCKTPAAVFPTLAPTLELPTSVPTLAPPPRTLEPSTPSSATTIQPTTQSSPGPTSSPEGSGSSESSVVL